MSGASKGANGRASGPVLQSVFFVVLAHSGERENGWKVLGEDEGAAGGIAKLEFISPGCQSKMLYFLLHNLYECAHVVCGLRHCPTSHGSLEDLM